MAVGDVFVTNQRRPILTLLEDTSPGVHDTLMSACDRYRYDLLGCEGTTATARTTWSKGSPSFG